MVLETIDERQSYSLIKLVNQYQQLQQILFIC